MKKKGRENAEKALPFPGKLYWWINKTQFDRKMSQIKNIEL